MIWVHQQYRRMGYARQLMQQAFDLARHRGCHGAWLETSNPDTGDFYRSIGFQGFGQLENGAHDRPSTHIRWFQKASLTA
jgi:ribosomal protein S18 acetylase RimI-like enzyme